MSSRLTHVVFAFQSCIHHLSFPPPGRDVRRVCVNVHGLLRGSASAPSSLTFRSLSRGERRSAECAFLQAVLELIVTGSLASWGPGSAKQEGNKGHRAVEEEEDNLKAESIPLRIGRRRTNCIMPGVPSSGKRETPRLQQRYFLWSDDPGQALCLSRL